MEDFIQQLPSNPWAWLFLAIITVSGFILAYRSTPQKVLKFSTASNRLITNRKAKLSKLDVLYDGISVNNLAVTEITFWNSTFPTINSTDIVLTNPLSYTIKSGQILDATVLAGYDTPNNISISEVFDNSITITFDYLDRKEGGIIQLIHTGKVERINFSGTIKGGKIKYVMTPLNLAGLNMIVPYAFIFFFIAITFFYEIRNPCIFIPKSWYTTIETYWIDDHYLFGFSLIHAVLLIPLFFLVLYLTNRKKDFIPKNCR